MRFQPHRQFLTKFQTPSVYKVLYMQTKGFTFTSPVSEMDWMTLNVSKTIAPCEFPSYSLCPHIVYALFFIVSGSLSRVSIKEIMKYSRTIPMILKTTRICCIMDPDYNTYCMLDWVGLRVNRVINGVITKGPFPPDFLHSPANRLLIGRYDRSKISK